MKFDEQNKIYFSSVPDPQSFPEMKTVNLRHKWITWIVTRLLATFGFEVYEWQSPYPNRWGIRRVKGMFKK